MTAVAVPEAQKLAVGMTVKAAPLELPQIPLTGVAVVADADEDCAEQFPAASHAETV